MQNMLKRLMALLTAGALSLSFAPAFAEETAEDTPVAETTAEQTVSDDSQVEETTVTETGPCAGYDVVIKNTCLLRLRRENLFNERKVIYTELKQKKKAANVSIRQSRTDLRRAIHERRELMIKSRTSTKSIRDIAKDTESGKRSRKNATVSERFMRGQALKKLQQMRKDAQMKKMAPVETPVEDSASDETETTEGAE